jgi:hypothetical protein
MAISFAQQDCQYIVRSKISLVEALATPINEEINAQKTFLDI